MIPNTDELQMPSSWREWWARVREPREPEVAQPPRRHLRFPTPPAPSVVAPSWAAVTHRVRQWPSGMPVTVDLLVATWHVGRGTAWHWLERLTRAGLLRETADPPNARGTIRRHWWVQ